jgi:hypothetical protein
MSTSPEPLVLLAQVMGDDQSSLKFRWRFKDQSLGRPYSVDLGDLKKRAKAVRKKLFELIADVRAKKSPGPRLKELAREGKLLYDKMFWSVDPGNAWAADARSRVQELTGPIRAQFEVDRLIHIPWGLLYDGDPQALPDDPGPPPDDPGSSPFNPATCGPEVYQNFWCMKYSVATIYHDNPPPRGVVGPLDASSFCVLPLLNKGVLDRTRPELKTIESDALNKFLQNPRYTRSAFLNASDVLKDRHGLLYFLCHANGEQLALDTEEIDPVDFDTLKPNGLDQSTACLVFLNGCDTAVGASDSGFLKATCRSGFYGFIGTETKVPDLFALRFGLAFLREFLCGGEPLYKVVRGLRDRHWPLSLLYSLYAYPLLSLHPIPDPTGMAALTANFSTPPIGSKDI